MASLEDQIKDLKENNNELVQKVQYWKITAAQRENEKLNLMKEVNELRLKLSRLRSNGDIQANNLDAAIQSASEKALAHLVRASNEITTTIDLAKAYMKDRQELDAASPRWSAVGSTPNSVRKDKVHRVPPLMMGGQSIQPVVALTMLNTSNPRSMNRSPNQNTNVTRRAVPMHMLQDVYIPLTRIDARQLQTQNMETQPEANNSAEDLGLDDSEERVIESERMSEDEDFDSIPRLDAVAEDLEPRDEDVTPPRSRIDNPLEGPSWMLDASTSNQASASKPRINLEPDSTTELEEGLSVHTTPISDDTRTNNVEVHGVRPQLTVPMRMSHVFSPTVRRRKRTSSPTSPATPHLSAQFSPRPVSSRRISNTGRVLKVLVAKMRLDGAEGGVAGAGGGASPPKRAALPSQLDAPSPNGATVAGVIVSETHQTQLDNHAAGEPAPRSRRPSRDRRANIADRTQDGAVRADGRASSRQDDSRSVKVEHDSRPTSRRDSRDSDSSGGEAEGRTRRPRKVVTYKEKPLNRKLRR